MNPKLILVARQVGGPWFPKSCWSYVHLLIGLWLVGCFFFSPNMWRILCLVVFDRYNSLLIRPSTCACGGLQDLVSLCSSDLTEGVSLNSPDLVFVLLLYLSVVQLIILYITFNQAKNKTCNRPSQLSVTI